MSITRRRLIATGAAALALPHRAVAEISLGAASLTTVSDGHLTLPGDMIFAPMPQDELAPILAAHGQDRERVTPDCNLALYRDGTRVVLFDAGGGSDFMPSTGQLADSLDALGLSVEDVTHVLFTHAHPDHIWGLLDDFDEPAFPEAVYMMGRTEWDYWWDPATVDSIGAARQTFAVGAKRRMEAIAEEVVLFDGGEEVLPGIAAVATPGHTPGHMAFEIRGGGAAALVIGDAVTNHHVSFARPDWQIGADQDQAEGVKTRRMVLDRLASEDLAVVGFHLPGGGIGRVARDGDGYRFLPG